MAAYNSTHSGADLDAAITESQGTPTADEITRATRAANKGSAGLDKPFYHFTDTDGEIISITDNIMPDGALTAIIKMKPNDYSLDERRTLLGAAIDTNNRLGIAIQDGELQTVHLVASVVYNKSWALATGDDLAVLTYTSDAAGDEALYINSQLQASTGTNAPATAATQGVYIGSRADLIQSFDGDILEMMMFNIVLTADEIASLSAGEPIPAKYRKGGEYISDSNDRDFEDNTVGNWTGAVFTTAAGGKKMLIETVGGESSRDAILDDDFLAFRDLSPGDYAVEFDCNPSGGNTQDWGVTSYLNVGGTPTQQFSTPPKGAITRIVHNFTVTEELAAVSLKLGFTYIGPSTFPAAQKLYIDNITLRKDGNTLNLNSFGHQQALDSDHPDIVAVVTGATLENAPVGHREPYKELDLTTTVPTALTDAQHGGYAATGTTVTNRHATNPATVNVGTETVGNNLVTAEVIPAATTLYFPAPSGLDVPPPGTDKDIDVEAPTNPGGVDIIVHFQRQELSP